MEKKKIIKNVLKIVLVVLAILLVIFIIHTIKNYVIITNLQNKIAEYKDSANYHIKTVATENNGTTIKTDYYKKDDKQVVFMEKNTNNELIKISMYNNGERTDTFVETKDAKIAQLNSGTIMTVEIYNYLESDNKLQTFLGCISAKIKSVDYNGKECYLIKDFMSSTSLTDKNEEIYIDKETGLVVKITETEIISEREYEINKVEDSIFIEPDIGQYTLKENN